MPRPIADRLDKLAALLVSMGYKHPAIIDPLKAAEHRLRAIAACVDEIDESGSDSEDFRRLLDAIKGELDGTYFT